ncbi:MAG: ABC transporter permease [Deltaproteobacteria bacterium]|nr:ABC transporter permease [Deltaproteobacteria bacterium]
MYLRMIPLAFRSLLRNKRRSAFTLGAIIVGVAVVIFINGFGWGLSALMVSQTINTRIGAIQVHKKGYLKATEAAPLKLDMPEGGELYDAVRTTPGVKAVARRIRFGGTLSDGVNGTTVVGFGLEPVAEFQACPERPVEVQAPGTHLRADKANGAVLGGELAQAFKAELGGFFSLSAPGREGAINALDLEVVGITRGAATLENKRIINVPLALTQQLLQMEGRVTEYVIAVDDNRRINEVAEALRARVGGDYEVSTWEQVMPFLKDTVARLRTIMAGISVTMFLIVILGIINTVLMSVFERVREIGTMLAVGMRRRQVLALFMLEALAMGMVGGVTGTAIGFSITAYFARVGIAMSPAGASYKQLIFPSADPLIAVYAVAAAVVGALVSAAYPARRAGQMNPVDALRML